MKKDVLRLDKNFADEFCHLKMKLFSELGEICEGQDISELKLLTEQYYLTHINKDLLCWGILQDNSLVSIGSLCLFTRIPYAENPTGLEGYILNVYTESNFRNCGFANQILDCIIAYSKKQGIKRLWLNSSAQGRRIYSEKGFVNKDNEMEIFL